MPHDDRTREGPLDNNQEWSRCNWFTHPVFKNLITTPSSVETMNLIGLGRWINDADSLWALRAGFVAIEQPGMRKALVELFSKGCIPSNPLPLWPHEHIRSKFLKEEISRSGSSSDFLEQLAISWPWIWEEDARQQGMGEAHPMCKLIKAKRGNVLELLFSSVSPGKWLDWEDPGSDRMMALLMRKMDAELFLKLVHYDERILRWRRKKDSRTILHEACSKLRPDIVKVLLSFGASVSGKTRSGETPAMTALYSVMEKTRPRQKYETRQSQEMMDRLNDVLHLLGASGGLKEDASQVMAELDRDHYQKMRVIVQRAFLSSSSPCPEFIAEPRRI